MEVVCSQTWNHVLALKKLADTLDEMQISSGRPLAIVYLKLGKEIWGKRRLKPKTFGLSTISIQQQSLWQFLYRVISSNGIGGHYTSPAIPFPVLFLSSMSRKLCYKSTEVPMVSWQSAVSCRLCRVSWWEAWNDEQFTLHQWLAPWSLPSALRKSGMFLVGPLVGFRCAEAPWSSALFNPKLSFIYSGTGALW